MSLILLYAASTFYHAIPNRRAKPIFRVMDHAAIYVLIAGTYTPFALLNLRGVWGWWLCGAVWVLAMIGVIFTALIRHRLSRATTVIYVVMGWMGLLAGKPAFDHLSAWAIIWLLAGGLLYTGARCSTPGNASATVTRSGTSSSSAAASATTSRSSGTPVPSL